MSDAAKLTEAEHRWLEALEAWRAAGHDGVEIEGDWLFRRPVAGLIQRNLVRAFAGCVGLPFAKATCVGITDLGRRALLEGGA